MVSPLNQKPNKNPLELDFSEWAKEIKYRLKHRQISSVGNVGNVSAGEYQDFSNVNDFIGYMAGVLQVEDFVAKGGTVF